MCRMFRRILGPNAMEEERGGKRGRRKAIAQTKDENRSDQLLGVFCG